MIKGDEENTSAAKTIEEGAQGDAVALLRQILPIICDAGNGVFYKNSVYDGIRDEIRAVLKTSGTP